MIDENTGKVAEHTYYVDSINEEVYIVTSVFDNGDGKLGYEPDMFYNQKITLRSYHGNTATISMLGAFTPSDLRKMADELDAVLVKAKEDLVQYYSKPRPPTIEEALERANTILGNVNKKDYSWFGGKVDKELAKAIVKLQQEDAFDKVDDSYEALRNGHPDRAVVRDDGHGHTTVEIVDGTEDAKECGCGKDKRKNK